MLAVSALTDVHPDLTAVTNDADELERYQFATEKPDAAGLTLLITAYARVLGGSAGASAKTRFFPPATSQRLNNNSMTLTNVERPRPAIFSSD